MIRSSADRPVLPSDVPTAVLRRVHLLAAGATGRQITDAVRDGRLLRLRRDHYLPRDTDPQVCAAVQWGGRLDCVSLLRLLGVFVRERAGLHIQLAPDASRTPRPEASTEIVRHWRPTSSAADDVLVPVREALCAAVRCQRPRDAVATLDSAWHLGAVDEDGLADVFAHVPGRYRSLRPLLDQRAEAGTETLVRLMLRSLGCHVDLQVRIDGVGRVDLLVDGWLVIECDSRSHHGSWGNHKRDRRRDAAAIGLGFTTLRLLAEDILFRPEWVIEVLRRAVARGPGTTPRTVRVHNSGEL